MSVVILFCCLPFIPFIICYCFSSFLPYLDLVKCMTGDFKSKYIHLNFSSSFIFIFSSIVSVCIVGLYPLAAG